MIFDKHASSNSSDTNYRKNKYGNELHVLFRICLFFYLYKLNLKLYVCKVAYHIQILSTILLIFLLHDLCSGDPNSSLPT